MIKSVKLGEVARISSGGTPSRANPSYWNGNIPWVKTTQIQNCVITPQDVDEWITEEGLKNSSAKMVPAGTIVLGMIGQGKTRGQVGYLSFDACTNQNAATITCGKECDSWFVYQYLLFNYENIRALSNSSGQGNLNLGLVEIIPITLPPLLQQKKIANLLGTWDNAIEKTEALIAAKEKQFEWLKSQLLLNNPKSKRWNTSALGEFIVEKKEKSTTPDLYPCLTSSRRGIFLQEDYFSKQVASKDNSGYKIMSRGDFTFRSMSDDGLFVFNKQTIIDKGLISPAYGVFSPKQNMDSDFLYYFLNSPAFRRALSREVQGGTRTALKLNALKKLEVKIPCIQEQKHIASKLNITKKEIDLVKELLEKYRSQKRGLMQKLLTGDWQVTSAQVGAEGELQDRTKENVA
ncbi:restriction endonuclease subunit S [Rosenbergiella epipactidis]|uniref:restriction endonuclease subunit S n=1 Tax=Rosenbergiella epipactidis TaxID=1544694 RepID=UPI001F4D5694|nr:restriction endonuclease subunit S [Rosenbergiella epipactidis]